MDSSKVIQIQVKLLRFFGMVPTVDTPLVLKLWGLVIFLWSGLILVCCQAITVFYVETTNEIVEELILLCTTSTVALKLAFFYLNRESLPNILDILHELDVRVYNEDSVRTMEAMYSRCRKAIAFYYSYFGSLSAILLELIFLNREERTWKSTALVPNEFAQKPLVYYGVLFTEGVGNSLNCFLAFAIDTYCFLLISLLAGHIEALSFQLTQFGSSKEANKSSSKKLRLLKHLDHFDLLDSFATELNKHLSLVYFVQVSISAPIICTCAYQFSQAQTLTSTQIMFLITYSIAMAMQIFTPNYFGTNVIENCNLLPARIFSSNWFTLERIDQKSVLLFMTRTTRPLVICAGSLYKMNINTFLKIMKSAYSLLAVLKSAQP